jgi:hypothetical protein
MTVVAYIPPTKKWILVHEFPVGNSSSHGVNYPVYYVLADSPLEFGKNEGLPIVINNTWAPNASPYVVWSPLGGPNGTIIVSDADNPQVYTNTAGGAVDKWEEHATPAGAVYSRAIQIFAKYPNRLLIYGGETFDDRGKGLYTPFSATVVKLDEVLRTPVKRPAVAAGSSSASAASSATSSASAAAASVASAATTADAASTLSTSVIAIATSASATIGPSN